MHSYGEKILPKKEKRMETIEQMQEQVKQLMEK